MRTLFLDCSSGISGDMAVGALCDLGIDHAAVRAELEKLGLGDEFHLHFSRQSRCGISGTKFDVHLHDESHTGHAGHSHGRNFRDIQALLTSSGLSPVARERSLAVFERIAVAEAHIHGMSVADVHFHEVGAIDSIVDIVAFCVAWEAIGSPRILASSLVEGTGSIRCAHGNYPLPAPATMEILKGIPLRQIEEPHEMITPTGAAILAEFAESFGPMPASTIERIGYGCGSRDTPHRPNVLRVLLGAPTASESADTITEIETNIDDLTPELLAAATDDLLKAGALDVFVTPIQMKKGRPGHRLTVLADPGQAEMFAALLFRHTSAFGVRMHECRRQKLRRDFVTVTTEFGEIRIKRGRTANGEVVQLTPEFDDCRLAADRAGMPVRAVYEAARTAIRP